MIDDSSGEVSTQEWIERLNVQRARAGRAESVVEAVLLILRGEDKLLLQASIKQWVEGTELCAKCAHVHEAHCVDGCDREQCDCQDFHA